MSEDNVKILLVEDNPGDARLITEMVKRFKEIHPQIETRTSLQEVMGMDGSFQMDVILLDLSLPDASGIELFRQVQHRFSNTPIIIITGLNDIEMIKSTVGEGVQDYLVKSNVNTVLLERAIQYSIWRNKYYIQRVEMEAAIREKQKLQEINSKLNNTLHQLEKSNSRLKEFAYMATHNLRSLTVNLTGLVNLYEQSEKDPAIFDDIRLTADNIDLILNDLIELVMLNEPVKDKKNILFADIFKTVKANIDAQIKSSSAEITVDFSQVESIIYPYSHLHSILLNLLTNAIKYSVPGKNPVIVIKTFKMDNFICLCVSDKGIGIDLEKHRSKLFRAFQRLHTDEKKGKGIGLYIVNTQVESLGGKMEVESKLGAGSTFCAYLQNDPDV